MDVDFEDTTSEEDTDHEHRDDPAPPPVFTKMRLSEIQNREYLPQIGDYFVAQFRARQTAGRPCWGEGMIYVVMAVWQRMGNRYIQGIHEHYVNGTLVYTMSHLFRKRNRGWVIVQDKANRFQRLPDNVLITWNPKPK